MILGDRDLKYYIKTKRIVIEPFDEEIVRENGLDLRLSNEIARFKSNSEPVDSKANFLDPFQYYTIEK
ncbi:MAG: dCTP deaminase, partial [Fervidicoccus fontis]